MTTIVTYSGLLVMITVIIIISDDSMIITCGADASLTGEHTTTIYLKTESLSHCNVPFSKGHPCVTILTY